MAKLSKKEFAEKCDIPTNTLSVYIKRGKVILSGEDEIDDTDLRNDAFLKLRQAKKGNKIEDKAEVKQPVTLSVSKTEVKSNNQVAALDLEKVSAGIEHKQAQTRLLKIKEEKIKGIVVPSALFKPVFLQHNQSIITQVKNTADEYVRIFAKKHDLNVNDVAEMNKDLISWFNSVIEKATKVTSKAIAGIVSDYSEKKNVGERE